MEEFDPRLLFVQKHAYENIQFADRKALFLATVNSLALGLASFLRSGGNYDDNQLTLFAFLIIALGMITSAMVIWPRSESIWDFWPFKRHRRYVGIVDANHIANLKRPDLFQSRLDRADDSRWNAELTALVWKLAVIHKRKYSWLRIAIVFSVGGWLSLGTALTM